MSELETAVIDTVGDMMLGKAKTLTRVERQTIASWSMKGAMVFEHVSRDKVIFYTDAEREALRAHNQLPESTGIWLARIDSPISFYARANDASTPDQTLSGFMTTLGYGCLAIQIVTLRTADYRGAPIAFPNVSIWQHLAVPPTV